MLGDDSLGFDDDQSGSPIGPDSGQPGPKHTVPYGHMGRVAGDIPRSVRHWDQHYLFPAFLYDAYTKLTDADLRALYAYLMTRQPVSATVPSNTVPFP